jgi:plasmid stabilization system protein ParE
MAWISQENLSAAENLRIAVGQAAQLIGAHPNLGNGRVFFGLRSSRGLAA